MSKLLISLLSIVLLPILMLAQTPPFCLNPYQAVACDSTIYSITTDGVSEIPSWDCGSGPLLTLGDDDLFEIYSDTTPIALVLSMVVSQPAYVVLLGEDCAPLDCQGYHYIEPGSEPCIFSFDVEGLMPPYYVAVSHENAHNVTYQITFGQVRRIDWVDIPDTRGEMTLDSSACQQALYSTGLQIEWNGLPLTYPVSYSQIGVPGQLCTQVYLKNPNGEEGLKEVEFNFGPDLADITPLQNTMPGNYNTGTWAHVQDDDTITWTFHSLNSLTKGDFTGTPNTCLGYEFCFNVTPLSNDQQRTNVTLRLRPDYEGHPAVQDSVPVGCALPLPSCPGEWAYEFTPREIVLDFYAAPLAVDGLIVSGRRNNENVILNWNDELNQVMSEYNVLRSVEGSNFDYVGSVSDLSSQRQHSLCFTDFDAPASTLFYQLEYIDAKGFQKHSSIVEIRGLEFTEPELVVYPNPAKEQLNITCNEKFSRVHILDLSGNHIRSVDVTSQFSIALDVTSLAPGMYLVKIVGKDLMLAKKIVIH